MTELLIGIGSALIALVGLLIVIIKSSNDRTKITVENTTEIKNLTSTIRELIGDNKDDHKEFREAIGDHESRISVLENKK